MSSFLQARPTHSPQFHFPRSVILAFAMVLSLGNGLIYMWSVFNIPLRDTFGYTASGIALAYSLFMLMSCVGSFVSGWLQRSIQPRFVILIAGLSFSLGWFFTGFTDTLPLLYLFYGGFAGLGNGMSYNALFSVATGWFPDKRGFANGVCTSGGGIGPVIFAPLGDFLIESFDVLMAFRIIGITWLIIYTVFMWFLVMPPSGWHPPTPPAKAKPTHSRIVRGRNLSGIQLLKQPLLYLFFFILMLSVTSGQMINGNASSLGQELAHLTAAEGAFMVSALGIGSVIGRLGFGAISDKIGRYTTLIIILGLNAIIMLFILGHASSFTLFFGCMIVSGACFGGTMSVMPSVVGDTFGSEHFGQNWSFVYPGYTAASFIGPILFARATETLNSCEPALLIAGILALTGIALVLVAQRLAKKFTRS